MLRLFKKAQEKFYGTIIKMKKKQKLKNHFVTKKSSDEEIQNRDNLLKIFKKSPAMACYE